MSIANKETILSYEITEKDQGRLDILLSEKWSITRSFAQKIIKEQLITCNIPIFLKTLPPIGTILSFQYPDKDLKPLSSKHFDVLFEHEDFFIINKHAGITVYPGFGKKDSTLVEELIYHYPFLKDLDPIRPGIVHRLDQFTSGAMIIVKNNTSLKIFQDLFKEQKIQKIYHCLIKGHLNFLEYMIHTPFENSTYNFQKKTSLGKGILQARTLVKTLEKYPEHSLLEVEIFSGKTHQIRVHLAEQLKRPILGDFLYGTAPQYSRYYLHSYSLKFMYKDQEYSFQAPYDQDFLERITQCKG